MCGAAVYNVGVFSVCDIDDVDDEDTDADVENVAVDIGADVAGVCGACETDDDEGDDTDADIDCVVTVCVVETGCRVADTPRVEGRLKVVAGGGTDGADFGCAFFWRHFLLGGGW
jgi:hypothetical protein